MSNAIKNRIKTYFTTYLGKEVDGELPDNPVMKPYRVDMNNMDVTGTAEEISSDIVLPETRIASTPEIGTESNSGSMPTEWNIDEQDDLFEAVFCGKWQEKSGTKKSLTLGNEITSFTLLEKFPQTPASWQMYTKEFINQLQMDFSTDSFVKLTWSLMGSNNPRQVFKDPIADKNPTYKEPLKTKSFLTKKGWLKIGDSVDSLVALRQSPSLSITINNNMERTPALMEEESIENSLGNFDITGTLDVYNVDDIGHELYNDAVEGKDKVFQVRVQRTVNGVTTSYTLTLNVHLGAPTKSRNGNKLQFAIPLTMNDDKDLLLEKEVVGGVTKAVEPVFTNTLENVMYKVGDKATELDGTATVTDNGEITYSWKKDGIEVGTEARYKPSTATSGTSTYTVTATNSLNGSTAEKTQTVSVIVNEVL